MFILVDYSRVCLRCAVAKISFLNVSQTRVSCTIQERLQSTLFMFCRVPFREVYDNKASQNEVIPSIERNKCDESNGRIVIHPVSNENKATSENKRCRCSMNQELERHPFLGTLHLLFLQSSRSAFKQVESRTCVIPRTRALQTHEV